MKHLITTLVLGLMLTNLHAQSQFEPVDKSFLDFSYFPADYPKQKISGNQADPLLIRVVYSRPAMNNRVIFGDLVEYGKVWRLGANEATEIEFFQPVTIGKVKVKKGRYTLYAIPDTSTWTIILNSETDTWGSFAYDSKKDLLRVPVSVELLTSPEEHFGIRF
ncbi:MAG TPA: DUF2911 domain-containing protein, partial [Ferruginibacter sp.]|nr:DUF2911 domain-containing protein [Ferruginibacter sp.]